MSDYVPGSAYSDGYKARMSGISKNSFRANLKSRIGAL